MTFYHRAIYDMAAIVKLMADKVSTVDRMQILTLLRGVLDYLDSEGLVTESDVTYEEPQIVISNLIGYMQRIDRSLPNEITSHSQTKSRSHPSKRKAALKVSRSAAEKKPPPPFNTFDNTEDFGVCETVCEEVTDLQPIDSLQTAAILVAQEDERKHHSSDARSCSNVKVEKKYRKRSTNSRQTYLPEGTPVVNPTERSRVGNKFVKKWPDTKWVCQYCRLVLAGFQYYKGHLTSRHATEGACCCRFCKKEIANGELAKYHPCPSKNKCTVCKKLFDRPSKLARHMKTHEKKPQGAIKCMLCQPRQIFSTAIECARHVFDVHETIIKCDSCFLDMDPTEMEIEDRTRVYCQNCEGVAKQKPKHVFHNSNSDVIFISSKVLSLTPGLAAKLAGTNMSVELTDASGQTSHRCVMCPFVTQDVTHLDSHMQDVHEVSNSTLTYQCSLCLVNFSTEEAKTNHVREKHEGASAPYQCPRCDKTFVSCGGIKQHIKSHLNLREFRCTVCPLRFNNLSDLNNHIAWKHTAGFPHKCTICGRRFRHRRLLKCHVKVVHERMVFMCPLCPQLETRNSSLLKNHLQRRHPEHKWSHASAYHKKSNRPYVMNGNRTVEGYLSGEECDLDTPPDDTLAEKDDETEEEIIPK